MTLMHDFRKLRLALVRAIGGALSDHNVGTAQYVILRELRQGGHDSQASLARKLTQDPAALARSLETLESRGWVERTVSESDRRQKEAQLTPEGEIACDELMAIYDTFAARIDAVLSDEERKMFTKISKKIIDEVGTDEDPL